MPNVIMLNVVMLIVIMLNVVMLTVIMLVVVFLSVIMLSVIMLGVVMLSVVAPSNATINLKKEMKFFNKFKIQEFFGFCLFLTSTLTRFCFNKFGFRFVAPII
jgi:hypothetical protein